MPVHDWTRVEAGTFHDFHNTWIIHLKEALNGGLLPGGYYALSEQHAGTLIPDVLTLHAPGDGRDPGAAGGDRDGCVTLAEAPPRAGRRLSLSPSATYRAARKTLTIRHQSGHRVVAFVEVVSPANKDRARSVEQFVAKVETALGAGCHVQVIDLIAPGRHDPRGLNGAIWDRLELEEPEGLDPPSGRLTLGSYVAGPQLEGYAERLDVGDALPEMPLFLTPETYIPLPLDPTYGAAYRGLPGFWRGVIEGREPAP